MNTNAVKAKSKLIKYQVYLGERLQESLQRYIHENYAPNTRVQTAIIRKAVIELLKREGYYDNSPREVEQ